MVAKGKYGKGRRAPVVPTLYSWNQLTAGSSASVAFSMSEDSATSTDDYLGSLSAGNIVTGYVTRGGEAFVMADDQRMLEEALAAVENTVSSQERNALIKMIEGILVTVKLDVGAPRLLFPDHEVIVSQIICGDRHCGIITSSGLLYTWGWNDRGQLGLGRDCWDMVLTGKSVRHREIAADDTNGALSVGGKRVGIREAHESVLMGRDLPMPSVVQSYVCLDVSHDKRV